MAEKSPIEPDNDMILVSRTGIVAFIVFSLAMTGFLMGLFMFVDFDALLGRSDLAMKIGQTTISLEDFRKIKLISGEKVRQMPEQTWAEELFETVILAEDARNKRLDENPEFINRAEIFAMAINLSEDENRIARSIFLLEELAKASIERLLQDSSEYQSLLNAKPETASSPAPARLHLRTLLLADTEKYEQVQSEIASGTDFARLNEQFSISPYRGVGGDIGWKSAEDLPDGVFAQLQQAELHETMFGYRDENGIHLFAVIDKPALTLSNRSEKEKQLKELKNRLITRHIAGLKSTIVHWVNPTLRVMCQIEMQPANAKN